MKKTSRTAEKKKALEQIWWEIKNIEKLKIEKIKNYTKFMLQKLLEIFSCYCNYKQTQVIQISYFMQSLFVFPF